MKKRKKRGLLTAQNILYLAVLVLILAGWWKSCSDRSSAANPEIAGNGSLAAVKEDELLKVSVPDDVSNLIVEYPGFTVGFNPMCHEPNYSAWKILPSQAYGEHPRYNKFSEDPDVYGCATLGDYRNSGYQRGHMAPAGDMKYSGEAMRASFFLTNICPQVKELNERAWNALEKKCRQWSQTDSTIFVVCGPVLTDRLTATIGESGVVVPDRFFKVVIAPYANPPHGTGFIMPNATVPGGWKAHSVTIDEVEEVTGMDFFAALPDELENELEQQTVVKWMN